MRTRTRRLIKVALLCGAIGMPTLTANARTAPGDELGGVWQVTVAPDDSASQAGKDMFQDMLLFENGQLSASACSSLGFSQADYSIGESGSSFSCTMTTNDETMLWKGDFSSTNLQGDVIWTKADGHVYHYTLSGARPGGGFDQQRGD